MSQPKQGENMGAKATPPIGTVDPSKQTEVVPGQTPPTPPMQDNGIETDKAKLQLLKDELAQSQNSIDADFIKEFNATLTPEEQELQFSDSSAYLALYEQKKEAFLKKTISTKEGAITELEKQIHLKEETQTYKAAMGEFLTAHREADKLALREFFDQDLTPRRQKELAALPPLEMYEELYKDFQKAKPSQNDGDGDEKVPLKLEGGHGDINGGAMGVQTSLWKRSI